MPDEDLSPVLKVRPKQQTAGVPESEDALAFTAGKSIVMERIHRIIQRCPDGLYPDCTKRDREG
jgi:hypothetical protein